MPGAVNYKGQMYKTVGSIKMNNGAFLVAINNNQLISVDFLTILNSLKNINFEIKKPTSIEIIFMRFIQEKLQQKINSNQLKNYNDINRAISDINMYINTNQELLSELVKLDNNKFTTSSFTSIKNHFEQLMSNNEYFKTTKDDNSFNLNNLPEYDEQAVTIILSNAQISNFDIDMFINKYFYDFNQYQISLLLNNFKLQDEQIKRLNERKDSFNSNSDDNTNTKSNIGKTKTFALPGIKESKEAAFVDTLLLSFTVGILCGIYLMYFILTIMS